MNTFHRFTDETEKSVSGKKSVGNDSLCVCASIKIPGKWIKGEWNRSNAVQVISICVYIYSHMRHAIRAGIPFIVTIKKKHKLTEKQQQKKNVDWDICLKSIRSAEPLDSSSQTIQLIANAFLIWMHIQNVGAIHHLTFSENQIEERGVFSDAIIHTIPNGVCDNFNQLLLCYSIYKYAYWIVKSFERREKTRIQFNSFNIIKIIFPIKIE